MSKIDTIFQQEFSLLTSETRTNPIHPLHARPRAGETRRAIRIGNRPLLFVGPVHYSAEELSLDGEEWEQTVAAKRQAATHECISMEMGEPCPHFI